MKTIVWYWLLGLERRKKDVPVIYGRRKEDHLNATADEFSETLKGFRIRRERP